MDRDANELRCNRCDEAVGRDAGPAVVVQFAIRHHAEHNYDGGCIVCRHDDSTFADAVLALVRQIDSMGRALFLADCWCDHGHACARCLALHAVSPPHSSEAEAISAHSTDQARKGQT